MRTSKEIKTIADTLYQEAFAGLSSVSEAKKSKVEAMLGKAGEERLTDITALVADVEAVVKAPHVDDVGLPPYLSKVTYEGDDLDNVTITVRTKLKSPYKYRKDTVVKVDGDFVVSVGEAFVSALFDMFYIEEAIANVNALNEKVAEIVAQAEVPYGFRFAVDTESNAMVLAINDKEVVFNANISKAHDVSSLGIFQSGDEYDNLVSSATIDKIVTALKAAQTPVQLIKANVPLIKDVTGVSTKKRASKLIRGSYHRQARYLTGTKAGVGYFDETVQINGEDVDVFALVAKSEDGELSIVLSPFDVKTMYNVEFDVISAVKEQMAQG